MKCAAALLSVLFWLGSASASQTFVLGAENAAGPWGLEDGTGCGNDVVTAAFKAAGTRVKLEILPYARAKALTLDGELAGCFAMAWEPSLEGKIVFAKEPLYSVRAVVFKNLKTPLKATTLAEVPREATIGIVTGYEYPAEVNALKTRGIKFEEATSEENNLKNLAAGWISAVVLVLDALKNEDFILRKAQVVGQVGRAFEAGGQGSFVGFSKKHPKGPEAKEAFDRGFAIIKQNGTYQTILDRWRKSLGKEEAKAK